MNHTYSKIRAKYVCIFCIQCLILNKNSTKSKKNSIFQAKVDLHICCKLCNFTEGSLTIYLAVHVIFYFILFHALYFSFSINFLAFHPAFRCQ